MKNSIKLVILGAAALMLASCATYSTIEPKRQWAKDISVQPSLAWNSVGIPLPGSVQWTLDGELLNSVTFISGVVPGKPLFKVGKRAEFGVFRADMLPNEIMELTQSSLAKIFDSPVVETSDLKPVQFGGEEGFQFRYRHVPRGDEVERVGVAAGAIKNGKLYVILCEGTSLVYYDKIVADAETILASAQIR